MNDNGLPSCALGLVILLTLLTLAVALVAAVILIFSRLGVTT